MLVCLLTQVGRLVHAAYCQIMMPDGNCQHCTCAMGAACRTGGGGSDVAWLLAAETQKLTTETGRPPGLALVGTKSQHRLLGLVISHSATNYNLPADAYCGPEEGAAEACAA